MSKILLKSSDDQIFSVEVKAAELSMTIKTMLSSFGLTEGEEPVPLPNVRGEILAMIVKWSEHHMNDPPYVEDENSEKRTDDISDWDKEFLNVERNILFEVILAANYLDIKPLLDLSCKTVANMIKGKTPEEIRKNFDLTKDDASSKAKSNTGKADTVVSPTAKSTGTDTVKS